MIVYSDSNKAMKTEPIHVTFTYNKQPHKFWLGKYPFFTSTAVVVLLHTVNSNKPINMNSVNLYNNIPGQNCRHVYQLVNHMSMYEFFNATCI